MLSTLRHRSILSSRAGASDAPVATSTGVLSRREVLAGLAALGAVSTGLLASERSEAKPLGVPVIDTHHHYFPPAYVNSEPMKGARWNPDSVRTWSANDSIKAMDDLGIGKAIVSLPRPGIWFGDKAQALAMARLCNDFGAQMVQAQPKRFGFFAAIPLPDPEGSRQECARAFDDLGASGIGLMTNYEGKYLGDPAFEPALAELDRRSALVYVHPNHAPCCQDLVPGVPSSFLEYPFDTTRTITSLLYNGMFAKYPNIRFIWSHGGGTIPILARRLAIWGEDNPDLLARVAPQGVVNELRRQYYDTVGLTTGSALAALMSFAPLEHIVFGSDLPYVHRDQLNELTSNNLPPALLKRILFENSNGLLAKRS